MKDAVDSPARFPDGFLWGTATSAYQIEGAVNEDGRGESIWDRFSRMPGRIRNGDTGNLACDHFHRYPEDIESMKDLGVDAYRFSIAWPRVFPDGSGAPNAKGLAFYERLVDALLGAGIEPVATLYHWDLPQALQARFGGWQSRETARAFADYAGFVASRLADRIGRFVTTNEIGSFVDLGYGSGVHAPGLALAPRALNQVRHHALLGHGLAVQAIRAQGRSGTQVGPAENLVVAVPALAGEAHAEAAERATRDWNAGCLTAMLEGRYPDAYASHPDAPRCSADDLRTIGETVDFVGINVYGPGRYVLAPDTSGSADAPASGDALASGDAPAPGHASGWRVAPFSRSHPRTAAAWQLVDPSSLYWATRHVTRLWNPPAILVTENGCAAADDPQEDGRVYDTDRVAFLRAYLAQLRRAIAEDLPVRGYFLWSLLDNFEWADGYDTRFGLLRVDRATQRRTPKLSASFYRQVVESDGAAP